jgi:hypothetical protein
MKQENAVVVKLISGQREHSFFTVDRYDYPTGDFEYHIYVSKNTPKTLNRKDMADYWSKENRNKGFFGRLRFRRGGGESHYRSDEENRQRVDGKGGGKCRIENEQRRIYQEAHGSEGV